MNIHVKIIISLWLVLVMSANAEETISDSFSVPLYTLERSTSYTPTKSEYDNAVNDRLTQMQSGNHSAFVNPELQPYRKNSVRQDYGIMLRGVGGYRRTYQWQGEHTSAAEEALQKFSEY